MKIYLPLICLMASVPLANVSAQTLQQRLLQESPEKLVLQAREQGNLVRGAILFHQGNINCAKCHRPAAEKDRVGPDLRRSESDVTDELIVESILQPSKIIKKGFETVNVLTQDGRLIAGVVISEDEKQLVLRDAKNVDQVITIGKNDVENRQPGTKSSMPDGLVNELKDRQQFLDLLRYVLDIRTRGPTTESATVRNAVRRELTPELAGLVLIQEMNCIACHPSEAAQSIVAAKQAPKLKWSAKWLNPAYLSRFIADPHRVKPGTSMPDVLASLDQGARIKAAEAMTHYLASTAGNEFRFQPSNADSIERGNELFHSVGCVACHSPRDAAAQEERMDDSVPMGALFDKYGVDGLIRFLENPHAARPSGRMPNMKLNHFEAEELASYLLQGSAAPADPWLPNETLAKTGKEHFRKFNCGSCHDDLQSVSPKSPSGLPLDRLDLDRGCLSDVTGDWPSFKLSSREKLLIRSTLRNFPAQLSNDQHIEVSLQTFRCIACHDRDELGGVTELRSPHFQTTNMNLGEQGRIPPTLTGVGAKLKPKWMREVLVKGRVIRPYMKTRMPQYGEVNIGHLVDLFQNTDRLSETQFPVFDDQKKMRLMGLEMAGNKGLNCVACHTYQYKLSDTMPAVDLTEMTERLKKDWFHQYMQSPQTFNPNTVMPSFWPGGVAIREDIEGDAAFQVEALWQYLIDGRQARAPSGVVREPLEIVVDNEAKMLRRNYQGIGKRGIGVGYPGGVNLSFDAEQMRLASVWKGKFVDPVAAWMGQGSGTVRPLGPTINFDKGPDLDDAAKPWQVDEGRPPEHHFQGYVLDAQRRPTFAYQFQKVQVEDFTSQFMDEGTQQSHLRRVVQMTAAEDRKGLSFRVASGSVISRESEGLFKVNERLRVRLPSEVPAEIADAGNGKHLRVPIDLDAGQKFRLMIQYLWD
ncbi:MAG: hypothetical protein AB8B91_02235 [Rubripirellula sp.]